LLTRWQHLTDEQMAFDDWLQEKEQVLSRMQNADLSDVNEVIEQVRQLKVCLQWVYSCSYLFNKCNQ
jgi:hypothetical protein